MRKHRNAYISLLLIVSLLFTMTACSAKPNSIIDEGSRDFAMGKKEDTYSLKNSGALLESLIDDFSGAYQMPSSSQMDDDDYDKAKKKADTEKEDDQDTEDETVPAEPSDPTSPSDGTVPDDTTPPDDTTTPDETEPVQQDTMAEVGDWDDFLRVFHEAYMETATTLQFRLVDGYTVDLNVDLQESFTELQREDPIYVGSVARWSWGYSGNEYLIEIEYTMDVDTLIGIKDETQALVEEAVAQIDTAGLSDYEIICAVNEYLCDTVYYPPNEPYAPATHTAYGALEDGVAVCEGYACAAKLMLNQLGILCDIQVGTCTNGGGHAWNLVYLDGQWYQLDVTWNDGSSSRSDYLLVTDDYMLKSRTWDFADYPACATEPYEP